MIKTKEIGSLLLNSAFFILLFYFIPREQFYLLLPVYLTLFALYIFSIRKFSENYLKLAVYIFPFISLFALPSLSDDFYRFIWDGRLIWLGENPFAQIPEYYFDNTLFLTELNQTLYNKLNSPEYFSVYPPVMQFVFFLSTISGSIWGSVIIMKIVLILSYYGVFYSGKKLLKSYELNSKNIFWLVLNPLFLIETIGNLHFELMMLFFLVAGLYYLKKHKILWASVLFALSVSTKLIPLVFLPALFYELRFRKGMIFSGLVGLWVLLTFLPFLSRDLIMHIWDSMNLYFQTFEFNAGIYYLVRYIGFKIMGYNIIHSAGPIMSAIAFFVIMFISFSRRIKLIEKCLYAITVYYLLASTIHPWYILVPLFFAIFAKKNYPFYWSLVIFLSYAAYSFEGYQESFWLIAIEYFVLFSLLILEFFYSSVTFWKLLRPTHSHDDHQGV